MLYLHKYKLRALDCLLQSSRRCRYYVADHRHRRPPLRHCRWPHRRLLVHAVSGRYILCNIAVSTMTTTHRSSRNIIGLQPPGLWIGSYSGICFSIFETSAQLYRFSAMDTVESSLRAMTGLVNVVRIHGRNGYALTPSNHPLTWLCSKSSAGFPQMNALCELLGHHTIIVTHLYSASDNYSLPTLDIHLMVKSHLLLPEHWQIQQLEINMLSLL